MLNLCNEREASWSNYIQESNKIKRGRTLDDFCPQVGFDNVVVESAQNNFCSLCFFKQTYNK